MLWVYWPNKFTNWDFKIENEFIFRLFRADLMLY